MNDRLKKLEALVGTWNTSIIQINADSSEASSTPATDTYRWSPSKTFLLHDADVQMNGEQTQSLEIIALDPNADGYDARAYEADGSFADYKASLDGKAWSITGNTLRFRGAFSEDGMTLSGTWEEKRDAGWQPMMRVTLKKQL